MRLLMEEPNIGDLLLAHWHELGIHKDTVPLDPDYQLLINCCDAGRYRVWAAYDGKTLVGYWAWWIHPHPHYRSTLTAIDDAYILSPAYRRGTNGVRLFSTSLDALRELGVKLVIGHSKNHFEAERGGLAKLYRRMGFEHTDNLWSRTF